MLEPKFSLTQKIIRNISEIERFYGRLEGKQVPKQLLLNLERDNLIQSSYVSNSIEGNPLSEAEVTNILLNDRVPANRNEKEVVNYFKILKGLEKWTNKQVDLAQILDIHEKLMDGVDDKIKGKIRNKLIVVGEHDNNGNLVIKHEPPFHKRNLIKQALEEYIDWLSKAQELPILKAGIFHHEFVYIHPFEDGNGRVCRLLTALIFLKYNYLINKYFVLDDYYDIDRELYSDSLYSADSGDKTEWLEYFTDGVKYSLQSSLGRIETGLNSLNYEIRPTPREKEVVQIMQKHRQLSSSELACELKISRQQAFNLLKSLTEKGYIEKKGNTKSSYYELK